MASITKIVHVNLYLGYTSEESVKNCFALINLLRSNGIKFIPVIHLGVEAIYPLNSWVYGHDYHNGTFTDFPVLLWQEVYDNYDVIQFAAVNVDEAMALVANKDKIDDNR